MLIFSVKIISYLAGGILSQSSASWRTIFWLQAGLGCILCVLGWFVLPEDDMSSRYNMGLDWIGAVLSAAGLGLLVCDLAYVSFLHVFDSGALMIPM